MMGRRKKLLLYVMVCFLINAFLGAKPVYADENDDYIEIWTPEELNLIRYNLDAKYRLMTDLDLSEETAVGGRLDYYGDGWEPIGPEFTGVFDGNGHTISGVRAKTAFFKCNNGIIKNVVLDRFDIYEGTVRAGLTAENKGEIINVAFVNSIIDCGKVSNYYVGGIAAKNFGTISRCYNTSKLYVGYTVGSYTTGDQKNVLGGISATNEGTIKECYNTGGLMDYDYPSSVEGKRYNDAYLISSGGIINDCYSCVHAVEFDLRKKMFPNGLPEGEVSEFYSLDEAGQVVVKIVDSTKEKITGEQIKNEANYSGFDFTNTWVIGAYTNYPYPQLRNNRQDDEKLVEMLDWVSKPQKTTYYNDEVIDATGGKIKIYYTDGTNEIIDVVDNMVSEIDRENVGQQTLTVTYRDKTITYKVTVKQRGTIQEIQLISNPDKTEFVKGTKLDFTGAVVRLFFDDDTHRDVNLTTENTTGGDIGALGEQTITYSYGEMTVSFDIRVIPIQITGIRVWRLPLITSYIEGQTPDYSGLSVIVEKNDGTKIPTHEYTLSEITNTPGEKEVTVSYSGFTASFTMSFSEKELVNIEVTNRPDKLNYIDGEQFDPAGMEVTAYYNNDTTEIIDDYEIGAYSGTGTISVPITYGGAKTYVSIRVTEKTPTGIRVATQPNKTVYSLGSTFNPDGMVVNLVYNSGVEEEITDYSISNLPDELGQHNLTITYNTFKTTVVIEMVEPSVERIVISKAPTKIEYIKGEVFDPKGMVVTAYWDNSTSQAVTDYSIAGFDQIEEEGEISVSYGGKSVKQAVKVHSPKEEWTTTKDPTCTALGKKQLVCKDCGKVLQTEDVDMLPHDCEDEVVNPTCTQKGYTIHTCKICGLETKDNYVDAKGHNYGAPTYKWSEDGKTCTATAVCANDANHVINEDATVTSEVTTPSTCKDMGKTTYTATFTNEEFTTQTKEVTDVEKLTTHTPAEAVKENEVVATCEADGSYEEVVYCSVCNKELSRETKTVKTKGHEYGEPTYTWSEDGKACTATAVCANDANHVINEDATVTSEVTTPSTCKDMGKTTYTATFTNEEFTTQTKEVTDVEKLTTHTPAGAVKENEVAAKCEVDGSYEEVVYCSVCNKELSRETKTDKAKGHEYGEPTYTWSEDGKACTAMAVCVNDANHVITEDATVTSEVTTPSTCKDMGKTTYTATFTNEEFTTQTKEVTDVEKLTTHTPAEAVKENEVVATCEADGSYEEVVYCSVCNKELSRETKTVKAKDHEYGEPTYTWSEDGKTCTAKSVCANDANNAITEEAIVTSEVTTPSTCKDMGKTTYTATFTNEVFMTQTKEVTDVEKLTIHTPAKAVKENEVAATCEVDGSYDEAVYCSVCHEELGRTHKSILATGHDWGEWKVEKNPTETTVGIEKRICKNDSSHVETREIPKLDAKPVEQQIPQDTSVTTDPSKDQSSTEPAEEFGKEVTDSKTQTTYVVTNDDKSDHSVEFKESGSKASIIAVPASVKIDGVSYKVTSIAEEAFKNNKTVINVKIGANVESIGESAFEGCVKLKKITLSDSVKEVGDNAFKGCTKLETVTIPKNATNIGDNAFNGCKKLKKVTIGAKVQEIGKNAFAKCTSLETIVIPASVKYLGDNAFSGDTRLTTIIIKTKKLTNKTVSKKAFKGVKVGVVIKVPKAKRAAYTVLFRKKGLIKAVKIKAI